MAERQWDLVVLGGGTAGIVGARVAATLGARVLLVERDRTGGDCLWTGCVPSKALLAVAARAAAARRADPAAATSVSFDAAMAEVKAVIAAIEPVDSPAALRRGGVHVRIGEARVTGARTVVIDGETVPFRHLLVATGAGPELPRVPGLADAGPLTSDTVWDLKSLPERLLVLGGGPTGCEFAQAFARLGSAVTLVEHEGRVLPTEDPDASAVLARALEADGVRVLSGHAARAVRAAPDSRAEAVLVGTTSGDVRTIGFDAVVVTTGRRARTAGLGLEAAGVHLTDDGFVLVDRHLRTASPRVWAAGDVTARPQYTHVAGIDGSIAASNAVLGLRRGVDPVVPRVVFTDPEVAAVGAATWSTDRAPAGRLVTREHVEVDRAIAEGRTDGFSRLHIGRGGRVLGATIVGPRAGESLAEAALAVRKGLTVTDVMATMHAYPTYGDGIWNATIDVVEARLRAPWVRRLTAAVVRARARFDAGGPAPR